MKNVARALAIGASIQMLLVVLFLAAGISGRWVFYFVWPAPWPHISNTIGACLFQYAAPAGIWALAAYPAVLLLWSSKQREVTPRTQLKCFGCGAVIHPEDQACKVCGWTWKAGDRPTNGLSQ